VLAQRTNKIHESKISSTTYTVSGRENVAVWFTWASLRACSASRPRTATTASHRARSAVSDSTAASAPGAGGASTARHVTGSYRVGPGARRIASARARRLTTFARRPAAESGILTRRRERDGSNAVGPRALGNTAQYFAAMLTGPTPPGRRSVNSPSSSYDDL
jgi:hypothetical protein